jgi:hypothetical protein
MKKWILIFCLIILVIISAVYFFIPTHQTLASETTISCTESGASRIILNRNTWNSWWPAQKKDDNLYSYKNCDYRIDKILVNGLEATIFNDKDSTKGILQIIAEKTDSTQLKWAFTFIFSNNPIKRLLQYLRYNNIKNNIESFIADIKKYFEKEENIYGMKVVKQKVAEASLISVKQSFRHYPTTHEIYNMINSLNKYIRQKGGKQSSYPMLNVHTEDSKNYEVMVAIPTEYDLPSEGNFNLKKMVLGNILMAEVKGGNYIIKKAEMELKNYVNDYKKISPAIPFQSLVTDRSLETDTAKWLTRLYYPVFN